MANSSFDTLTRFIGGANTRRGALRAALGGAAATATIGLALPVGETEARNRKKKCKTCKAIAADATCSSNKDCCTNETDRACSLPENSINTTKTCCGVLGAPCGGGLSPVGPSQAPFCCRGYLCSTTAGTTGICEPRERP